MNVNFCPVAIELSASDSLKELSIGNNMYCIAFCDQVLFPVGSIAPVTQGNQILGVGRIKELRINFISENNMMTYVTWEMIRVDKSVIEGLRYLCSMNKARGNTVGSLPTGVPGIVDEDTISRIAGSKQPKQPKAPEEEVGPLTQLWENAFGTGDSSSKKNGGNNRWLDI